MEGLELMDVVLNKIIVFQGLQYYLLIEMALKT